MMKIKKILAVLFLFFLVSQSALAKEPVQMRTMLEIRSMQTQYLDTNNSLLVTKAVVNTLQDNGFIIQQIEPELGYLKAKKEVKLKRTLKGRVAFYSFMELYYCTCLGLSLGLNPSAFCGMFQTGMQIKSEIAPHTVIFDSNIVIEPVGKRTKVRFSVIEKVLENGDGYTTVKSSLRKVVRHHDPEIYQEFFNQLNKNLFLERSI